MEPINNLEKSTVELLKAFQDKSLNQLLKIFPDKEEVSKDDYEWELVGPGKTTFTRIQIKKIKRIKLTFIR